MGDLGPDLQNILQQSYDYLMIMPKLRLAYDGLIFYEKSFEQCKARFTFTIARLSEIVLVY